MNLAICWLSSLVCFILRQALFLSIQKVNWIISTYDSFMDIINFCKHFIYQNLVRIFLALFLLLFVYLGYL